MEFSPLALTLLLVALASVAGLGIKITSGRSKTLDSEQILDLKRIGATKNGFPAHELGKRATLVQFSTQYCGQCPGVARSLSQLEYRDGGLRHLEVDITERLDVAAHFGISQTPTVFILDSEGRIRSRISGVPKPGAISQELERIAPIV